VADARTLPPEVRDPVELVWTGPETPEFANRDTRVVVRELFATARESVLVAGYAVYQGKEVFRTLGERMDQDQALSVRMFLDGRRPPRDTTLRADIIRLCVDNFRKKEWPGRRLPELYYDPRSLAEERANRSSLHAKCIVIDSRMAFVSSANFTEAAQ